MAKKVIAFDIETIANPAMINLMPEIKAKANLVDPAKIEADISEKLIKQRLGMGLDPMCNMICCLAWAGSDGCGGVVTITTASKDEEKKLISAWWDTAMNYDTFVTFNGRAFDLRCLLLHGMEYSITPSINIDKGKYNRGNHIDLRGVLAGQDAFAKGTLDFFCKKFLGEQKTEGIDGEKVQSFFDMGLIQDIADYCINDAELTYKLYEKAERAGLLE